MSTESPQFGTLLSNMWMGLDNRIQPETARNCTCFCAGERESANNYCIQYCSLSNWVEYFNTLQSTVNPCTKFTCSTANCLFSVAVSCAYSADFCANCWYRKADYGTLLYQLGATLHFMMSIELAHSTHMNSMWCPQNTVCKQGLSTTNTWIAWSSASLVFFLAVSICSWQAASWFVLGCKSQFLQLSVHFASTK